MIKIVAVIGGHLVGLVFPDADAYRHFKSDVNQEFPGIRWYKTWTGKDIYLRPAAVGAYGKPEAFE